MSSKSEERRRLSRIRRRAVVTLQHGGQTFQGLLINFSEVGMYVQMENVLPEGSPVTIPIRTSGSRAVELQGRVVWSHLASPLDPSRTLSGIGIELSASPEEYLRFVAKLRTQLASSPRGIEERFEVYHKVRFKSGSDFLTEYTENLSRGGMYLASSTPLEHGAVIKAQLEIQGFPEPIEVEGRVAYRLDEAKAQEMGRTAGMGIQFVDLSPEAKAKLGHYIKRLEIHRSRPERRQIGKLPEKGSLSDHLVPELLIGLLEQKATGTLILESRTSTKLAYLSEGHPIYVESNLRNETLGQFLVRQGKLTPGDLEESLEVLSKSELHHGEIMVRGGMLDSATLAIALVEHQEEKLSNTFPWFEGKFEFVAGTDWPPNISMLPLRSYQIIFSGISKWFDAPLIGAWMGLDEDSAIVRGKMPPKDASLPPIIFRLLEKLEKGQTMRKLSAKLEVPVELLLPYAFGLVIAGWAELDFSAKVDISTPIFKKEEKAAPAMTEMVPLLRRWVEEDFERLRGLDFYELFALHPGATEVEITKAYLDKSSRYSMHDVETIQDGDIKNKIVQILAWIRLAYDTLRDPNLREVYGRKGKAPVGKRSKERVESERHLLACIRDLEQGNIQKAVASLTLAAQMYPENQIVPGYLGWAIFCQSQRENHVKAAEMLDAALEKDPSDPLLSYYRGEIFFYLGDWMRAEKFFQQAVRLYPGYTKAQAALDLARDKRQSHVTAA